MKYLRRFIRIGLLVCPALLVSPGARAVWRGCLIDYILPFMSRLSGLAAFPVSALAVMLLIGALITRPRRAISMALALVYLLSVLWLPLYGVAPYALPAREGANADALCALCEKLGARANVRYQYKDWRADSLLRAGEAVDKLMLSRGAFAPPKRSRFPEWMRALRVAGVYLPVTGEALISELEPDALKPFTACHEAAHARGLANEGQANIAAYLACARAGGDFEYSASITALAYALRELRGVSEARAEQIEAGLTGGVRADIAKARGAGASGARIFGDYADLTLYLLMHPEVI